MPVKPSRAEPFDDVEPFRGLSDQGRHELVAETFHTFGEETARWLADHLDVEFTDCAEAIRILTHRPH